MSGLNTMKNLADKQLVVKITGSVQSSNLAEFEQMAVAVIAGINTTLVTDQDFSTAEQDVKSCSLIETRLQQAKTDALNGTKKISDLVITIDKLTESFRQTRLLLNGKVKTEKDKRVNEILAGAKNRLAEKVATSPAKHGFAIDHTSINFAVKGKKSLAKMQEAVDLVIAAEELRLITLESVFTANIAKIEESESQWPGLFPDRQNVALSAPETVEAMIVGRVADHRLKMAEKAKKEQEEKEHKERAETERIAREARDDDEFQAEQKRRGDEVYPPSPVEIPIPEPFAEWPLPPPTPGQKTYRITVTVSCNPDHVIAALRRMVGVVDVVCEEVP